MKVQVLSETDDFLKRFFCAAIIFIVFLASNASAARPHFLVAASVWSEGCSIFLANVKVNSGHYPPSFGFKNIKQIQLKTKNNQDSEILTMVFAGHPKNKYPMTAYKGLEEFCEKNQNRKAVVYALASNGIEENGCLYQIDAKTGEVIGGYPLPYPLIAGDLLVEDVYFSNQWRSVLILHLKKGGDARDQLLILDITDPSKVNHLKPLLQFPMESGVLAGSSMESQSFSLLSKPKVIRTQRGDFGILLGTKHNIVFISFENPTLPITLIKSLGDKGFLSVLPIDLYSQGKLDFIYALDGSNQLWNIDIRDIKKPFGKKITSFKMPEFLSHVQKILAVKSSEGPGIELLVQAENKQGASDIIRFMDKNNPNQTGLEDFDKPDLIKEACLNFYSMANGLLFIHPKYSNQKPMLFFRTRKGYAKMEGDWQRSFVKESVVSEPPPNKALLQAEWIWDRRQKQIKIITLNEEGQLNILEPMKNAGILRFFSARRVGWHQSLNQGAD